MTKKKPLRRLGDITNDLEVLLMELHCAHDLQHGEVLNLINGWQKIHVPDKVEVYIADQSKAVLYYGHKDGVK